MRKREKALRCGAGEGYGLIHAETITKIGGSVLRKRFAKARNFQPTHAQHGNSPLHIGKTIKKLKAENPTQIVAEAISFTFLPV